MTEHFIGRLERVRETGPGRWIACCPSHDDNVPSLSIRKADDERILIHCFAGCPAADVVAAVGLSLADLYPRHLAAHPPCATDGKHTHAARAALKALDKDVLIVAIAAENVARGVVLDDDERQILVEAASRIREARRVAA